MTSSRFSLISLTLAYTAHIATCQKLISRNSLSRHLKTASFFGKKGNSDNLVVARIVPAFNVHYFNFPKDRHRWWYVPLFLSLRSTIPELTGNRVEPERENKNSLIFAFVCRLFNPIFVLRSISTDKKANLGRMTKGNG